MTPAPIFRVGLTGGIASGKSTVAAMFLELGAFVVDADALAHALIEPGGAAQAAVIRRFGNEILDARGHIDRKALGRIVFNDRSARADLNAILHPEIRAEADRLMQTWGSGAPFTLFDAALLVETGAWRTFDKLVVVRCTVETQLRRLVERDATTRAEARTRIDAQMPLDRKLQVADFIIDNNGDREATRRQTEQVFTRLSELARVRQG